MHPYSVTDGWLLHADEFFILMTMTSPPKEMAHKGEQAMATLNNTLSFRSISSNIIQQHLVVSLSGLDIEVEVQRPKR